MTFNRDPSQESLAAYEAWKALCEEHAAYSSARPRFPALAVGEVRTEEQHRAVFAQHHEEEGRYWAELVRLSAARDAAFVAMAKTLPKVPARPSSPTFSGDARTVWFAAQMQTEYHEAYPMLVQASIRPDGEIVSVNCTMWDDAIPEAAKRNAEWDAYYASRKAAVV